MNILDLQETARTLASSTVPLAEQAGPQGFKSLCYRFGDKRFTVHYNVGAAGAKAKHYEWLSKAVDFYNTIELSE